MSVIYTHILYHFYAYYLPHLILHDCFVYVFAGIWSRAQIIQKRENSKSIHQETYTEIDAELEAQWRNNIYL